jgi:hypothetical protein
MSYFKKVILQGTQDNGTQINIPATSEGHLEISIHGPVNANGSLHTESFDVLVQGDASNGINLVDHRITTGSNGSVIASGSLLVCKTGTNIEGFGAVQSRRRIRFRPGQALSMRTSGYFDNPVANSIQIIGFGHAESGIYFGYNGTSFGILNVEDATREIRTLNISTKSSTAENVNVTLNGINFSIPVTNGATTSTTAFQISSGSYDGWSAIQQGSSVFFLANDANPKTGSFFITGSTLSGSFSRTLAGSTGTQVWYPQTSWTGDKLDGTGPSGVILNPQKGNHYGFDINPGFGSISCKIEASPSGSNNPLFTTVHTILANNTRTIPSLRSFDFPFTAAAYSLGSSTNLSVIVHNWAMGISGKSKFFGNRFSISNSSATVNTNYTPLFTIRADTVFNGKAIQQTVNLISISGAIKDTQPATIFIIKNANLAGPNFSSWSSTSAISVDTTATSCNIVDNNQLLIAFVLPETGGFVYNFVDELKLQPGETWTVAGKTLTGTATYMAACINIRDDF